MCDGEWMPCWVCRRHREKGKACVACTGLDVALCSCDALTPPARAPRDGHELTGAHRHFLHSLLELRYQLGVEAADPWIEKLIEAAWWNHDEGDRPPTVDWREKWHPYLEAYPALAAFLSVGVQAVFDWAEVPDREADVFLADANGFTIEAIAQRYGIQKVTVEARLSNAQARIQSALEFSLREVAI